MRTLKTLVFSQNQNLDTNLWGFDTIQFEMVNKVESVIESMNNYDLLLIDKNVTAVDFKRINKLADILFAEAAVVNINLNDVEFLKFKLNALLQDWASAQAPVQRKFMDSFNTQYAIGS